MVSLNRLGIKVRGNFIASSGEFSTKYSLDYKNVSKDLLKHLDSIKY